MAFRTNPTEVKTLTDSQKLDLLNERLKRMQRNSAIQTAIVVLGFIGIISFGALLQKGKKILKDGL